jgi:molecular chaperone HtpG
MKIGREISSLYENNSEIGSFVQSSVSGIISHIKANRMEFFPEYTDHDVTHLEQVLSTASSFITRDSWELFTAEDAGILVVSVALHDFGMHLTKDGFETLVSENSLWKPISGFPDKPWHELWLNYFSEATRFDERKLRSLFGDNFRAVRHPPAAHEGWDEFDYLLVGDFLRRNHPRLAHEIATQGMPGKNGTKIPICPMQTDQQQFFADMAGLVARSHGSDLRDSVSYLEQKYQNRVDPRRVHAPFIMVLLRIADYFQMQHERAPKSRTDAASFKSPLSNLEWRVHQSVTEINNTSTDPEALTIIASPKDAQSFLRLSSWLKDIQQELDKSWAVIGEIYGLQGHNNLNKFGIKIRRVKSNLDDIKQFEKSIDYIPKKIGFDTAGNELLKLLVGPLYGGDVKVGVRELLQNAVDAVRECEDLPDAVKTLADSDRYDIGCDVHIQVKIDKAGNPTALEVTDQGTSMTLDTLTGYFLKAGASFRKSDEWKRLHRDEQGKSKVLRSGRFGVGALAAFLLGDEIRVVTRHVSVTESEAFEFTANIDDEAIDIRKVSAPIGTKIEIRLSEEATKALKRASFQKDDELRLTDALGQYGSRHPYVRRLYGTRELSLVKSDILPSENDENIDGWIKIDLQEFIIFWKHGDYSSPSVLCNGFVVVNRDASGGPKKTIADGLAFSFPTILVYDREGLLPVNLQRDKINFAHITFTEDLWRSVTDNLVAYALVNGPSSLEADFFAKFKEGLEVSSYSNEVGSAWVASAEGFMLRHHNLISAFEPDHAFISVGGQRGFEGWGEECRQTADPKTLIRQENSDGLRGNGYRRKGVLLWWLQQLREKSSSKYSSGKIFIPKNIFESVLSLNPGKELSKQMRSLEGYHKELGIHAFSDSDFDNSKIVKMIKDAELKGDADRIHVLKSCIYVEANFKKNPKEKPDIVSDRWLEVLGQPTIPFDPIKRSDIIERAKYYISDAVERHFDILKRSKKEAEGE